MNIIKTVLPGVVIIEPQVFEDPRGYFYETWQRERYQEVGIDCDFSQDNESKSVKGVVRGLHYQMEPWSQSKLVRVVKGKVFDVAVDLRKGSPTFGKWFGLELDDRFKRQIYIPPGFAHGFSVLSETAVFSYKCSNLYNRDFERSVNPYDPELKIDWNLGNIEPIVSVKDQNAPSFLSAEMNFIFKAQ